MTQYTLQYLEDARAELEKWTDAFSNDSSNNPNKYQSEIKNAKANIRRIECELKRNGTIPLTEHEALEDALDKQFPNAQSKEVVNYQGKKYQRRFFPLEQSRSRKTIKVWGKEWVVLTNAK